MTGKKPSSTEDEYFAREEAQRTEVARLKREQAQAERERQARVGTCPRGDATKLVEEVFQTIRIDRCPTCKGVWLDPGELEQIATDKTGLLQAAFEFFAGKSPTQTKR